jgi:TetR/AcrR family transcriptional regulator, tetracycline repressor protein
VEEQPARSPGQRAGLSQRHVVEGAIRVYTASGLDGLSMRSVAKELCIAPNALYSHVKDKDELLDLLVDRLLVDVPIPKADTEWRDALTELMSTARQVLIHHPDLMPTFLSRPTRGPNALRLADCTLGILSKAGVHGENAVLALRLLLVFTFGFAAQELPRLQDPDRERISKSREAYSQSNLAALNELSDSLSRHPDDHTFGIGLRWLIDGIEGLRAGPSNEAG